MGLGIKTTDGIPEACSRDSSHRAPDDLRGGFPCVQHPNLRPCLRFGIDLSCFKRLQSLDSGEYYTR